MGLTTREIKHATYQKQPRTNAKTGKLIYPKQILWDHEVHGLGLRVQPSGLKSFVYQYRTREGHKRLITLGQYGVLTLETARKQARVAGASVIDGQDPLKLKAQRRSGELMSDLCTVYLERHAKPRKRSWKDDASRIRLYILPWLGIKRVEQITRAEVAKLHDFIGRQNGAPYQANRVREQLSKMFEFAKSIGLVEEDFKNPAQGIIDFEEHERDAYIEPDYLPLVKAAIDAEENKIAGCAIWLLILTGKRKTEILTAKWSDLNEQSKTLRIPNTKNGEMEFLPLSSEAWKVIEKAKEFRTAGNPFIFPGKTHGHLVNLLKPWRRITRIAESNGAIGISKVTIHGLRHTFAVFAVSKAGVDLGMARELLNQKSLRATTVYAKYLSEKRREVLETQGNLIAELAKDKSRK
jgi:integrase